MKKKCLFLLLCVLLLLGCKKQFMYEENVKKEAYRLENLPECEFTLLEYGYIIDGSNYHQLLKDKNTNKRIRHYSNTLDSVYYMRFIIDYENYTQESLTAYVVDAGLGFLDDWPIPLMERYSNLSGYYDHIFRDANQDPIPDMIK